MPLRSRSKYLAIAVVLSISVVLVIAGTHVAQVVGFAVVVIVLLLAAGGGIGGDIGPKAAVRTEAFGGGSAARKAETLDDRPRNRQTPAEPAADFDERAWQRAARRARERDTD